VGGAFGGSMISNSRMSDATTGQLIVAGTAVVSGALGLLGGLLIERVRDRGARLARAEARRDARDEFQRQTLLDLQEAAARMGRAIGRAHHHDTMAFRQSGEWGKTLYGDDLSEEMVACTIQLRLLAERIRDDDLRPLVYGFSNRANLVTGAKSEKIAQERMDDCMASMVKLQDHLGTVLRAHL
jgi:hypothetical protein